MEGGWNGEQSLPEQVKGRPEQQQAHEDLDETHYSNQSVSSDCLLAETFQTKSANDPIVMLADAFPAEGAPAFRAACDGLAKGVVETTFLGDTHPLASPPEF
jgi:hypothetical protein